MTAAEMATRLMDVLKTGGKVEDMPDWGRELLEQITDVREGPFNGEIVMTVDGERFLLQLRKY